jgi:AraC-like DNA-binding protein
LIDAARCRTIFHMIFRQFSPAPPLDRFIANFWYWKGDPLPHRKELIMASPTMGLLVNLHEDALRHYEGDAFDVEHRSRGIALSGANTQNFAIDAVQPEIMGVQFHAGGAFPFFAPSARLFCNLHVALEDVWGAEATRLHHRLVEAPTIPAKFDVLHAALLARMPRALSHHPAVDLALARFGHRHGARVGDVAAESGLCRRRFIDLFAEEVGFTPKLYLRLRRFQGVLKDVFGMPAIDWSEVAYRHGYADQSHFNREFREFSGLTPSQYHARPGQGANHVELIETA